jgi:cytidylate kinase
MPVSIEALIDRQFRRWEHELRTLQGEPPHVVETPALLQPVLTVSREHGSRGAEVAARVAARFGYALLHRNMIDRICESTGYTRRLLQALDEHARSRLTQWLDSMLSGRLMDESDYAIGLLKTIRSIAALGGVVVVGRGANFIVGPDEGVHVRIVAPREERIEALRQRRHLSAADAAHEVEVVDQERRQFIRRLVGRAVDDPLGYDLVLNQSGRSVEVMADIVIRVAEEKFDRLRARPPVAVRER